jgi:hypothetical protein
MTLEQLELLYAKTGETLGENPPVGVVFTPVDRARDLLIPLISRIGGEKISILEPTSGAGNLVIATIQALDQLKISPRKVNIVSVEIDSEYLDLQRAFIRRHYKNWEPSISFRNEDFIFGSDESERFDLVVMNPPWVGYKQMAPQLRHRLKVAYKLTGQFDFLDAFVLKAFSMTKLGGRMALFLPDKVVSSHQPSNSIDLVRPLSKTISVTNLPSTFFTGVQHESVFIKLEKQKKHLQILKLDTSVKPVDTIENYFSLFRGLELSGRSSTYLTSSKYEALDQKRIFISGREMNSNGTLSTESPRYISKDIPRKLLKNQFEYSGPAILIRKTGNPVNVCYVDHLPFVSQVVFVIRPKPGVRIAPNTLKKLAQYLQSPAGQQQLKRNSGKLSRVLFPYVTLSDIKNVEIEPTKLAIKTNREAA